MMEHQYSIRSLRSAFTDNQYSPVDATSRRLQWYTSQVRPKAVLVQILSDALGERETSELLALYSQLKNREHLENLLIIVPDNFKELTSSFISSLYLIHKGLGCNVWVYGKGNNNETSCIYELIHLMYSAFLSGQAPFFNIATYDDEISHVKVWGQQNNTAAKKVVLSHKNLPMLPVDKENFSLFFRTSVKDLLLRIYQHTPSIFTSEKYFEESGEIMPDKDIFRVMRYEFYYLLEKHSLKSIPENVREIFVGIMFFKMLADLYCLKDFLRVVQLDNGHMVFSKTHTLSKYSQMVLNVVEMDFINNPLYQMMTLSLLVDSKKTGVIRQAYIEVYNHFDNSPAAQRTTGTLIGKANGDILNAYSSILANQSNLAREVFRGIYELAKNAVEHSTHKHGVVITRTIDEDSIQCAKNDAPCDLLDGGSSLWKKYGQNIIQSNGDNKFTGRHLDISVIDDGENGIIETTLNELNRSSSAGEPNKRVVLAAEAEKDNLKITKILRERSSDESQLLFDLYFNRDHVFLERQTSDFMASYGILHFREFVCRTGGVFRLATNQYREPKKTVAFYCFNSKLYESYGNGNIAFGTTYNILLPLRWSWKEGYVAPEPDMTISEEATPPDIVFNKMLHFEVQFHTDIEARELPKANVAIYKYKPGINCKHEQVNDILSVTLYSGIDRPEYDGSDLRRFVTRMFFYGYSAVLVRNATVELIDRFVSLAQAYSRMPKQEGNDIGSNVDALVPLGKAIFFQTRDQELFVLAGTVDECGAINDLIKKSAIYSRVINFKPLISTSSTSILAFPEHLFSGDERICGNPFFVSKTNIIHLDVFRDKESGLSPFEDAVRRKLTTSLDAGGGNQGYMWQNTHLKIGAKLHLRDYTFGKRLFQINSNASKFAYSLASDIYEKIDKDCLDGMHCNYTIIGYAHYSELLVSRVCRFLKYMVKTWQPPKNITIEIGYVIVADDDEDMSFFSLDELFERRSNSNNVERLIIVVPISSTLTTCLKIENAFYKHRKEISTYAVSPSGTSLSCKLANASFIQPFYTSVVVGDGKYDDVPTGDLSNTKCEVRLFWKQINKATKTITTINREEKCRRQKMDEVAKNENISGERENKFQLYIESQWQLPTECIYCFPENDEDRREIPLVATDKAQVTPELVFSPPTWYMPVGNCWTIASLDFENRPTKKPSFLHIGHYHRRNKHYRYYLRYPELIAAQRDIIEDKWVKGVKEQIKKEWDKNISPRVLIVAPNKRENGEFIHIINDCVFDGDADILEFDIEGDCVSNFSMFSKTLLDSVDLVFYVDNLMATAQTFLSIVRTFQNLDRQGEESRLKISGIFSLINMMNPDCFYSVEQIMHGNMYFFLQLDVPPVSTRQGATPIEEMCPLCKSLDLYTDLMKQSVLDVMRAYYQLREIPTYQKTDEGEHSKLSVTNQKYPFRNEYVELLIHDLLNKVFTVSPKGEFKYTEPFSDRIRSALSSKQSYAWSDAGLSVAGFRKHENSGDICFTFNAFIDDFRQFARANKYDGIADVNALDDLKLKANLIKVLSAHPFKNHRGIYITVFYWVLNEIVDLCDSLESKPGSNWFAKFSHYILSVNDADIDSFDPLFNYVRLLVKYGANLRIAFLTSKRFIRALQIIDNCMIVRKWRSEPPQYSLNQQTVMEFRMFCAAHILRSVNNIESRSIRLEENVRFLLANSINDTRLNDTRLLELILHENTILIRMFKRKIQNLRGSAKERIEALNMIREHDSILQNCHRLISQDDTTEGLAESFADLVVFLTKKQTSVEGDQFEDLAKELTMRIGKVLGYAFTNAHLSGAFFVYRLYDGSGAMVPPTDCFRVMCKVGDDSFVDAVQKRGLADSFSVNFLNGLAYDESNDGDKKFFWTSYSIRRDRSGGWIGQDGRGIQQNLEFNDLNPDIRRITFYRVSKDGDNQDSATPRLLGQAVFVFYDSSDFDRIKTIRPRYVGTLREDILGFLKEHYESDAFRAYLVKEEQMQAWQTLSGRSAHKIGNLVTAAEGALGRAGRSEPDGDKAALSDLKSDLLGIRRIVDEYRKFAVKEPCNPVPTDVRALLERAARQFRSIREGAEVALVMTDDPLQWNIDPARMTEAIGELLENALAFSAHVTVTAQAVPQGLQIRVTDQGPGVTPDLKTCIFAPFYSSRPGGSGLGLAIVRQIVENHGGTIEECGQPGQGACFVIELPETKEKQT